MDNLNVCLINDSFPPLIDGVANAVTNYAQIINNDFGRASVITPDNPKANDDLFSFPVIRYPSIDMTKKVGYPAGIPFSAKTLKKAEESGFDIIHSHCPITSTMLARIIRDRISVPVVLTYHTKFDIDIANAIRSKLLQEEATKILAENIAACDEVWTVSRGAGENLRSLGYQGDYIVMPNGVDLPKGRVEDSVIAQVTDGLDLPAGIPVFLFVGRMMWYKGIRITLDALKILSETGVDYRMVFIGGGNDKEEIVAYADSLNLGGKVFFVAPIHDRNQIRAWYSRADLFLFPSTFDTNGLVVREAAACALGSVLIAGSCAAEDVTDGVNGILIEENSQSMACALQKVCDRPEVMKMIGEGAQRDIYMSWQEAVSRAYQRYGIVIDKFEAGEYPAHEKMVDRMFQSVAGGLAEYNKVNDRRLNLLDEVHGREMEIVNDWERIRAEAKQNRRERMESMTARSQKILARMKELAEYIDRSL